MAYITFCHPHIGGGGGQQLQSLLLLGLTERLLIQAAYARSIFEFNEGMKTCGLLHDCRITLGLPLLLSVRECRNAYIKEEMAKLNVSNWCIHFSMHLCIDS